MLWQNVLSTNSKIHSVCIYPTKKTKIQSTWIITNYVGLKRQERLTLAFSIAILLLSIDALL